MAQAMALVLYLHHEAPVEEQNFQMVMEMIRAGEVKEEDESYQSPLDRLFRQLEHRNPDHIAVKYYKNYRSGSAKTLKSIQLTLLARLDKFNLESVLKSSKADTLYSQITLFGAIESAFFVLSIAIILYIIAKNGKESLEKHAHLFIGCDYSFAISEYKEKMKKNIILTGIFTLLSALTYVIMVAIKPTFPDFIMVNMICEVALAILLAKTMLFLHDDVYKRILAYS